MYCIDKRKDNDQSDGDAKNTGDVENVDPEPGSETAKRSSTTSGCYCRVFTTSLILLIFALKARA